MRTRYGGRFDAALLEQRPGFVSLRLAGNGVASLAVTEPGGHRWQAPSGKKSQIHTSTVTVAVLAEPDRSNSTLDMRDVRIECYKSGGAGGQHRNKTDSAVRATHEPTGTVARSEGERSQHVNRTLALAALAAKLAQRAAQEASDGRKSDRKGQVGSGMRGDKVRSIRTQDGVVTDHRTGRKSRLKEYLRGDLSWLA